MAAVRRRNDDSNHEFFLTPGPKSILEAMMRRKSACHSQSLPLEVDTLDKDGNAQGFYNPEWIQQAKAHELAKLENDDQASTNYTNADGTSPGSMKQHHQKQPDEDYPASSKADDSVESDDQVDAEQCDKFLLRSKIGEEDELNSSLSTIDYNTRLCLSEDGTSGYSFANIAELSALFMPLAKAQRTVPILGCKSELKPTNTLTAIGKKIKRDRYRKQWDKFIFDKAMTVTLSSTPEEERQVKPAEIEKPTPSFEVSKPATTKNPTPTKTILRFEIPYRTNFGERVVITGNQDCLGQWDPNRGIDLQWSQGDLWFVEGVEIYGQPQIEFKFIIMNGPKVVRWEGDGNHQVAVGDLTGENRSRATVRKYWQE